ncbi:GNAT family N-acetyltransferase [Streptacidiphilus fuscans]|uniref:GNAT family N-acetyltransferase n=1 Tax=Streptacidiphilus fuscans TaxID=2789292 RepID=A0A931FFF2_9ACTN|nr:GNAT family N-acetyltransferase [Streptacidiphilus fuscans]MBF9068359.1 GNAT family N-acetyltransferase [Streptacidiphilus fuscans]
MADTTISAPTVSAPTAEDYPRWRELFIGYATFYHVELTEERLAESWAWIHDVNHPVECLLARDADGTAIGLAHFAPDHSPLRGTRGFLHDLFVDPARRGSGAVDALLGELRRIARERGWYQIRWNTADDNYRARAVYDRHGEKTPFLLYVMPAE